MSALFPQKTPLLAINTNPSTLASNLRFLYHPCPQMRIETRIQAAPFGVVKSLGVLEVLAKSSTITLAMHNPKLEAGRMTIGFLQSITNKLCIGAELLAMWSDRNAALASVALAGR